MPRRAVSARHRRRGRLIRKMPEPIVKQDGTAKNDCERNAAKRFLVKLRQDHPHLKCIVTEDSLSSNAPHIETLHAHGCTTSWGSKKGSIPICSSRSRPRSTSGA